MISQTYERAATKVSAVGILNGNLGRKLAVPGRLATNDSREPLKIAFIRVVRRTVMRNSKFRIERLLIFFVFRFVLSLYDRVTADWKPGLVDLPGKLHNNLTKKQIRCGKQENYSKHFHAQPFLLLN